MLGIDPDVEMILENLCFEFKPAFPRFPSSSLSDIPSVLADSAVFNPDDGSGGGGFVVHWLNNKDLSFTSSMDLFMLQLRKFSEQQLDQTTDDPLDPEGSPMKFDFGTTHNHGDAAP